MSTLVAYLKGLGFEAKDAATILAALIAAAVAVFGWFIVSGLTRRREDRTKRLELTIQQSEKQTSEFYSPLVFLILRLDAIYRVKKRIVEAQPDIEGKISEVLYREYFLPTHEEIAALLKTKIHLLEGSDIPESLLGYVRHFTSENLAWRLARDDVHVWRQVEGFPSEFFDELRKDQQLVYDRYERSVRELRHGVLGRGLF